MDTLRIVTLIASLLLTALIAPAMADTPKPTPQAESTRWFLAQLGPRQRGCGRTCENNQVNCQRGCFAKPDREEQDACSRQCLAEFLECAERCDNVALSQVVPDADLLPGAAGRQGQ